MRALALALTLLLPGTVFAQSSDAPVLGVDPLGKAIHHPAQHKPITRATNPNASGPPFVDGQPLPAAGLNHATTNLGGALSDSLPSPTLAPSGVTAGSYDIVNNGTHSCELVGAAGQILAIVSGSCGTGLVLTGNGSPLTGGGNLLTQ